jgi:hypothetical protein
VLLGSWREFRAKNTLKKDAMNDSDPPNLRRRWYRFSLRTLVLFVVFTTVGFGLVGIRLQQGRNDRRIVAKLKEIGPVAVQYDSEDVWGRVVLLYVSHPNHTDASLNHLKGLTNLQTLDLANSQITDTGLEHLKGLKHLEDLHLGNTQIGDAGLKHLKGMTNLKRLGLELTQVTDEGVSKLRQALPNCRIRTIADPKSF